MLSFPKTAPTYLASLLVCLLAVQSCKSYLKTLSAPGAGPIYRAPAEKPETKGDPSRGLAYLINGDYIGSGIPNGVFQKFLPADFRDTVWQREGPGARAPYRFNVFQAFNGAEVLAGNCFTCHSGRINGQFIPGLGDPGSDFTKRQDRAFALLQWQTRRKYGPQSAELAAFKAFSHSVKGMSPYIVLPQAGANPAFRLEEGCAALRNPQDLTWASKPVFAMSPFPIGSDVPPLWQLKKKTALYYNGMGRGDFRKLLMQASVLGIPDSAYARAVLNRFDDVLAWVLALNPPPFPGPIDKALAEKGQAIFVDQCAKCHGSYGPEAFYPNKIIPVREVGTDSLYARYFLRMSGLPTWYNAGWFGQSEPVSQLLPSDGYIAPPLDGVWCTAPYFHNGSVPTLEGVLNSNIRPAVWSRKADGVYHTDSPGWAFEPRLRGKGYIDFDTRKPGFGKDGHPFADSLEPAARKALIEYLKTL